MILKIIKRNQYEGKEYEEVIYKGNIKEIQCHFPLDSKEARQTITIYYEDGREEFEVIGIYNKEKEIYEPTHKGIYLMNEEGKTIERL